MKQIKITTLGGFYFYNEFFENEAEIYDYLETKDLGDMKHFRLFTSDYELRKFLHECVANTEFENSDCIYKHEINFILPELASFEKTGFLALTWCDTEGLEVFTKRDDFNSWLWDAYFYDVTAEIVEVE